MNKVIIGVDPGAKGAIGVIDSTGNYGVYDIPVIVVKKGKKKKTMIDLINLNILIGDIIGKYSYVGIDNRVEAWVESVHSMPGQGVVAMFSMGRGLGNIEMVLTCHNIPINWVSPQKWKKEVIFGAGSDKLISIDKAKELFPNCEFQRKRPRSMEDMDGRAEAMLIAEYGRRQNKQ